MRSFQHIYLSVNDKDQSLVVFLVHMHGQMTRNVDPIAKNSYPSLRSIGTDGQNLLEREGGGTKGGHSVNLGCHGGFSDASFNQVTEFGRSP